MYNLPACQMTPGLSLGVRYMQLFVMSEFAKYQTRREMSIVFFSVFANQGVVEGLSAPQSSKHKCSVCFLLGPSMIFSSLGFNVFLLQSWERTTLVTLSGSFYSPCKAKTGDSFSQHPIAWGLAGRRGCHRVLHAGLICKTAQVASRAMGAANTLCLQVTATLMPLSDPVTQFPEEIRM